MKLSSSILVLGLASVTCDLAAVARAEPLRIAPIVRQSLVTQPAQRPAPARFDASASAAPARSLGWVEKFQRPLSAGEPVRIGRTPSFDRDGTARLNRFVFRRAGSPSAQR